ncbi:PaaI family thioesterase [Nocardioides sp. 31GB23]|uniref:Acyl-coenzyme A thioesterase THEM4 n=1 Tax=Nocardioides cremeus TaxID=3058044 RepID=A0ABT8TV52_9ACTN|nr:MULTISPECIES: PaaI family thioesterase [Nocardioides]KQY61120.1 thioesterase [Nocardioides sp. Root140]KRF18054.1 thioesterase [Nocardioides sp. Soil796]MDO3397837.1 PaaI family thioesterase [Nocardioides cremeus]
MTSLEDLISTWAAKFRTHPDGSRLPAHHAACLGCGENNPHGHHLRVHREGDGVVARHTFDERHVGAPGIAHGGAVAAVVDDFYGFLLYLTDGPAVTRNLVLDYLAPVLLGVEYELRANITRTEGRKLFVEATMSEVATSRRVVCSTALFLKVDVGHFLQGEPTGSFGQGSGQ